jgi:hypothetical protein
MSDPTLFVLTIIGSVIVAVCIVMMVRLAIETMRHG